MKVAFAELKYFKDFEKVIDVQNLIAEFIRDDMNFRQNLRTYEESKSEDSRM